MTPIPLTNPDVTLATVTAFFQPHYLAAISQKYSVLLPLGIACGAVIIGIPVAAWRGRLHVEGYIGISLVSFLLGLLDGWLSGVRGINGTMVGFGLSIMFFLVMSCALGCFLAFFFYRHPRRPRPREPLQGAP